MGSGEEMARWVARRAGKLGMEARRGCAMKPWQIGRGGEERGGATATATAGHVAGAGVSGQRPTPGDHRWE